MSTRYYPIFQRGNPQLRIFLPNFWMKLVKPKEAILPNQVLFQTSIEMTKFDVKNYLEKIYKVPVVDVQTTIKMGTIRRSLKPKQFSLVKEDDYKEALVTMPKDCTFEFPDMSKQIKEKTEDRKKQLKLMDSLKEDYKKVQEKNMNRKGIPHWFHI